MKLLNNDISSPNIASKYKITFPILMASIIILSILICGCSKELSRSDAEELIINKYKYPISTYSNYRIGKVSVAIHSAGNFGATVPISDNEKPDWTNNYLPLIKNGMLKAVNTGQFPMGWKGYVTYYDITPTIKLDECSDLVEVNGVKYVKIRLVDYEFKEITGIIIEGNNERAIVEYINQQCNRSEAYIAMWGDTPLRQETLTCKFVRYDDGWRIIE